MAKFKFGDKVECISPYLDYNVGDIYEVYNYKDYGNGYETVSSKNNHQIINSKSVSKHFKLLIPKKVTKPRSKKETVPKDSGWGF